MDSDKACCHSADKTITCEEVAYTVQREGDGGNEGSAKSVRAFLGLHSQTIAEKINSLDHRSEIHDCFYPSIP